MFPTPVARAQFYLFPCGHGFHVDCLKSQVMPFLDEMQMRAVADLEERVKALSSRARDDDKRALTQLEYALSELDGYFAGECPLCGSVMIRSIGVPLVLPEDEEQAAMWAL